MRNKTASFPVIVALLISAALVQAEPLPSWNDGAAKTASVNLVVNTTTPDSAAYVPPAERIAVFDNDGTLWAEQPIYFQLAFALDRVKALAPQHPEWQTQEPFASLLKGDLKTALSGGERAVAGILAATHTGLTTDEFNTVVLDWIRTARHPVTGRAYTAMVYQPMLDLLAYLRANGYKTFIVSGGGVEFMRAFTESVYGIPPEQVVGSSGKLEYKIRNGRPVLLKLTEVSIIDDKAGKPVGIQQHIGRRPVLAFGNSDGDFEMLEWTTSAPGARLGLFVHHDDADREWAYDRESSIGQLARGLDEASNRGWIVVSMQDDWKQVYPN
jgi:phosphoglycolate phosphatase-like HAD superfamily hydrolase